MNKLFIIILLLIFLGSGSSRAARQHLYCLDNNYVPTMVKDTNITDCRSLYSNMFNVDKEVYDQFKKENTQENRTYNENLLKAYLLEKKIEKERKEKLQREAKLKELKRFTKNCEEGIFKKGFKKGTSEFEKCMLNEEQKEQQVKFQEQQIKSQEQKRLVNLPPSERHAYTCEKTYGFRKGSETFKECVFKIMTTEHEMQTQINQRRIAELEARISGMERSTSASNAYNSEMLEIERMKAKAMQDQVNFARNKDVTDTLLGISRNLLTTPSRPAPNAPQMFNCQTRKFGGFDQIQCF